MKHARTILLAGVALAAFAAGAGFLCGAAALARDESPDAATGFVDSQGATRADNASVTTRPSGEPGARSSDAPPAASGRSSGSRNTDSASAARPAPPAMPGVRREDFVKQYAVVYEKNIFLRDRPTYYAASREARPDAAPAAAPRRAEESYVVTGIALQEGRHVAFIENTDTGETRRVLDGESVATGKVISLDPDALEFERAGKRTRVAIGRNLAGDVVFTRPAPPPVTTAASTTPGGAPGATSRPAVGGMPPGPLEPAAAPPATGAPDPNDPNLSVEERMRLRRQQSGGR